MSESTETNVGAEESSASIMSAEDKFFGVKTQIVKKSKEKEALSESDDFDLEIVDDNDGKKGECPRGMLLDHTFGRASTNNKCNDFIPTNIANPKIAYLECKILLKPEHCVRSNQLITKVARGARPSWGHGGEQQPLGSSSNYRRKRIGNTLTNSATPLTSAACNGAAAETSGGN